MMDNDQPWEPPEQPRTVQMPKVSPTVPDVTIFSPSNQPPIKRSNFMQRVKTNEAILKHSSVANQPHHLNMFDKVTPSVPDLSLFEPQVLNSANRNSAPTTKQNIAHTSQNVFAKTSTSSKENIFLACSKPSVPDLTILDDEPKKAKSSSGGNDQVFSETYKKMLIKSHEQFMKQMKNDVQPESTKQSSRKSTLFNPQRYQENPLRKYAPAPQPAVYDGNSSSILVEFEEEPLPAQPESNEKPDEMTFKKVAEMLSKIQKLVIPETSTPDDFKSTQNVPRHLVLRKLASSYLTPEELEYYDVDKELKEMEQNEAT